ncbi:MAG: hypothetical protein ABIJ18_00460 [archaeon]
MKESKYKGKKIPIYKRKEFFTYLVGIFIISLMVLSLVSMGNTEEKIEYNGLKFVETENGFISYLESGRTLLILSNPEDLKDVEIDSPIIGSLVNIPKLYISVGPSDDYQNALYDLNRNIGFVGVKIISCYEDSETCSDLLIKTCDDATQSEGIIIFKEDNETLVTYENNCLTIQGKSLLKVTDKLILDQYD